jgi:hypothetical protein
MRSRTYSVLDRIGAVGVLLAAIAAPCCFPLFAAIGTAAGFSVLEPYEGIVLLVFKGSALLTLLGLALSCRRTRNWGPLIVGIVSCLVLAIHFCVSFRLQFLYGGLFGLIAASVWNHLNPGRRKQPVLESRITCPKCGYQSDEVMPTNACLFFYDCPGCNTQLKPLDGDCCVFCSYGSVRCPPMQVGESCCT